MSSLAGLPLVLMRDGSLGVLRALPASLLYVATPRQQELLLYGCQHLVVATDQMSKEVQARWVS